jgi:hypothetical protein
VIEIRRPASAIALGVIGGDDVDPGAPTTVGVAAPTAQINAPIALHHVDHDAGVEID